MKEQPTLKVNIQATTTTTVSPNRRRAGSVVKPGMTMWRLLLAEFNLDSNSRDQRAKPIKNQNIMELLANVRLPIFLENFMIFGLFHSLLVFLQWFVIIPSRFVVHSIYLFYSVIGNTIRPKKKKIFNPFWTEYKNDTITVFAISFILWCLRGLDTSKIYHNIRVGTAIKLYFMVQVLEVGDKLLSASGQDIIRLVYSNQILTEKNKLKNILGFLFALGILLAYLLAHSYVLVYQVMALNVAINSYSNALLTMILSLQFSELKSAVFKRTEREGLFQMTCSDLNERFLLLVQLAIISSRNLLQICINSSSTSDLFKNMKPNSWYTTLTPSSFLNNWVGLLLGPSIMVIGSEILVDWVKHAYIVRFNRIKPEVYSKYIRILALDFVNNFTANSFGRASDDFPSKLTKRTGFPVFVTVIVFTKLTVFPWLKYWINSGIMSFILGIVSPAIILIFLRLIMSLALFKWSKKILRGPTTNVQADYLKGAPNANLCEVSDIRELLYDDKEKIPMSLEEKRLQKALKDDRLESVVRFEMADKKIW